MTNTHVATGSLIEINAWMPVDNVTAFDIFIPPESVDSGVIDWYYVANSWLDIEYTVSDPERVDGGIMLYASKCYADVEYEKERIEQILMAAQAGMYRPGKGWPKSLGFLYVGIGIDAIVESRAK